MLAAGGDAQVVAYVGHNHLMDVTSFDWGAVAARGDARARGAIAIACHTALYMQDRVPGPTRAPLLFTRDYLYANAAALEGTILAFARGGDYAAIRRGAAESSPRAERSHSPASLAPSPTPATAAGELPRAPLACASTPRRRRLAHPGHRLPASLARGKSGPRRPLARRAIGRGMSAAICTVP
jgi:hypothetical protein